MERKGEIIQIIMVKITAFSQQSCKNYRYDDHSISFKQAWRILNFSSPFFLFSSEKSHISKRIPLEYFIRNLTFPFSGSFDIGDTRYPRVRPEKALKIDEFAATNNKTERFGG